MIKTEFIFLLINSSINRLIISVLLTSNHFHSQFDLEEITVNVFAQMLTPSFSLTTPAFPWGHWVLSFLPVCLTPVRSVPCAPPPYHLSIQVPSQYHKTLAWHHSLLADDWLWLKRLKVVVFRGHASVNVTNPATWDCPLLQKSTVGERASIVIRQRMYFKRKQPSLLTAQYNLEKTSRSKTAFSIQLQGFLWHGFLVIVSSNTSMFPPCYWLTCSLSPQPSVPVTALRVACLSGPAGCLVSVHGAGDNDFPPVPASPPHLKLQWWRWLQLDDFFL